MMTSCVGVDSGDVKERGVDDAAADDDEEEEMEEEEENWEGKDIDDDDDDADDDEADVAVMNANDGLPAEDHHPPPDSLTSKSVDHRCS